MQVTAQPQYEPSAPSNPKSATATTPTSSIPKGTFVDTRQDSNDAPSIEGRVIVPISTTSHQQQQYEPSAPSNPELVSTTTPATAPTSICQVSRPCAIVCLTALALGIFAAGIFSGASWQKFLDNHL